MFRLCYVDGPWAWFTTRDPFTDQWGDDWDDSPYQDNAGDPYEWAEHRGVPRYELLKVAYDGNLWTPADLDVEASVKGINANLEPWLRSRWVEPQVCIHPGDSFDEFVKLVELATGSVYRTEWR
jgi:hypothetical protein